MNNLLSKMFGRKAKAEIKPTPFAIIPYDGGITIYGLHTDDNITVGMTEAPDLSTEDHDFTTQNCIVNFIEGDIDCEKPNAVALLHSLANMLGYEVRSKSQAE